MGARFKLDENLPRAAAAMLLDFSDLRRYAAGSHDGIWVLRPAAQTVKAIVSLLQGALGVVTIESAQGRLWIIEPGRIRIRE